ncbi:DUF1028 domain-containing protein [Paenactinomyces guangxiensis]|uniref:DUF1028 domain-containing protein n=1 Tax=Paenactinomyces guangxiensis TaxID=1490290 RepID=A0A7W1WPB7_9BACL|nr:DUF1028 domain-containing protein [Paenactinomyces guangxiensis]MBA4493582.1 DUF1028 domain-containing protein [Paenactinomyces guangxiensis]MBH8590869.1 DUF1028 domain-containing protein [Paenactinomyces guangxiensis]
MGKWVYHQGVPAVSTFSIVAHDAVTGELGIAVQSKFLAVGSAVPWAAADAGAIATQSWANTGYGPRGLEMLRDGKDPDEVLQTLLKDDPGRELRQVGIVDHQGRSATFTGSECLPWAGGIAGPGFACQGNILAGAEVVQEMARVFQETSGNLPERLVASLAAGQKAGGDRRGMQSAALYVVKPDGGYGGFNDRYIDLRVDDHSQPIEELERLLKLHRLYFERSTPEDLLPLEDDLLAEVRSLLHQAGYKPGDTPGYDKQTKEALKEYFLTENFDERWTEEPVIDRRVLEYMRNR